MHFSSLWKYFLSTNCARIKRNNFTYIDISTNLKEKLYCNAGRHKLYVLLNFPFVPKTAGWTCNMWPHKGSCNIWSPFCLLVVSDVNVIAKDLTLHSSVSCHKLLVERYRGVTEFRYREPQGVRVQTLCGNWIVGGRDLASCKCCFRYNYAYLIESMGACLYAYQVDLLCTNSCMWISKRIDLFCKSLFLDSEYWRVFVCVREGSMLHW